MLSASAYDLTDNTYLDLDYSGYRKNLKLPIINNYCLLFDPEKPLTSLLFNQSLSICEDDRYHLLSWKMIPYSRPKLSDFYVIAYPQLNCLLNSSKEMSVGGGV